MLSNREVGDQLDHVVVQTYEKHARVIGSELRARTTINSGATFGQLDVQTHLCEISDKHQSKRGFTVRPKEMEEAIVRANDAFKLPVLIGRDSSGMIIACMPLDDFLGVLVDYEWRVCSSISGAEGTHHKERERG
jgi:hypothetical protein